MRAKLFAIITVLWVATAGLGGLGGSAGCGDPPLTPTSEDIAAPDLPTQDVVDPDAGELDTPGDSGGDADSGADAPPADVALDAVGDAADTADAAADGGSDTADAAPDAGPPCTPVAFAAPGSPTGWDNTSTELFTVTQGGPNHRGQDVVATPDGPQILIGKFVYGPFDKDLKDEVVEVFVQRDAPCGDWVSQGTFKTSDDGEYGNQYPIEDDGGRVFWELTGDAKREVGLHPVVMLVHGDHSTARFNLHVFDPAGTDAVLFDIDGTLTTTDAELIPSLANEIFDGTYIPELHPGGHDVVWAWADKGYQIVYLTARPDFLKEMTRDAHKAAGFPPGVLHFTNSSTGFISAVAEYKADFLLELAAAGVDINAAYGNADTDIEAYETAGLDKATTFIIGDNAGVQGTVALDSYVDHLPWVTQQPDAQQPAPSPVQW